MLRLLAVAALLVLPAAGAKAVSEEQAAFEATVEPAEVDTTLYFHPINVQDMPISTLEPRFTDIEDFGFGAGAATLTCADRAPDVTGGTFQQELHTYYGYSTPNLIDYDTPSGGVLVHRTRGLGYDVPIDRTAPTVLHWFMAEWSGVSAADAQRAPLPNVVVQAVLRQPVPTSVDDTGYGTGAVLMQGSTLPVTAFNGEVVGDGSTQVTASQVDGRWVYGFEVPMAVDGESFNASVGYNLDIQVKVDNAACSSGSVMPGTAAPFADQDHRPRIEVRTTTPLRVEGASVLDVGNSTLALRWDVLSGWGNYDVAVPEASLEVFGPDGAVDATFVSAVQRMREHYHFMEPYEGTWAVSDLPDGTYTAIFTVPNLQHTATAEARLTFNVQNGKLIEGELQEAPGISPLAMLVLVAALALARRR